MASMPIGSPRRTKVRSLARPTYNEAGCTSRSIVDPKLCRFTSVTAALADTVMGSSGFWPSKSSRRKCVPVVSVRPS